ncbi:ankyrin [Periconia macrospinosa]|uniref:Ankyrin n=1 Tax=Periconia macrospinosa TaxID=97972 RepID=A0A2V1DD38_9PLEO|nr:ankyrin [Periconia macrospinosa]
MPVRREWSHILDNNERRKAQNRAAQRNYRNRQRRRLEAAETILDMTQISPAAGQRLLGLLHHGNLDNLLSGDSLFPNLASQNSSILDGNSLDFQHIALSPSGDERCIDEDQTETFPTEVTPAFESEGPLNESFHPLSLASDFETIVTSPVNTQSPNIHPMVFHSSEASSHGRPSVSTTDGSDHDDEGCNPLLAATFRNDINMVKLLTEKGADLEKVDKDGRSALLIAVERDNDALAQVLLELGADIRIVDRSGQDLFQKAAARGSVTMLRTLLEWCKKENDKSPNQGILRHCVNRRGNKGRTLVHTAAWQGKSEIVEVLLEYGADINASSI